MTLPQASYPDNFAFLQSLRNSYGKTAWTALCERLAIWQQGGKKAECIVSNRMPQGQSLTSTPLENVGGQIVQQPVAAPVVSADSLSSGKQQATKIIEITDAEEWDAYKAMILQMDNITRLLETQKSMAQDVQHKNRVSILLRALEKYQDEVRKKLVGPESFDERATTHFVMTLAKIVEDKLWSTLDSCYYNKTENLFVQLLERLDSYFQTINLQKDEIISGKPATDAMFEHCKVTKAPNSDPEFYKVVKDVIIQPYYFTYINEDGEKEYKYIDGSIIVYGK